MKRRPPCSPLFPYTTLFRPGHDRERRRPRMERGAESPSERAESPAEPPPPPDRIKLYVSQGAEQGWDKDALAAALSERSEEHTSELQSLAYLVCRLLLEKKK